MIIIATGSELQLAVEAQKMLADKDIRAYVVSMPCVEWFEAQPQEYRDSVLPPAVSARVAVEAGVAQSWYKYVGDTGEIISIEHYGESADDKTLFREFGFTPRPSPRPRNAQSTTEKRRPVMAQNPNLAALAAAGVSIWLDDLSRDRLRSGNLQELIDTKSVVGVTTNPSIFQAALSKGNAYDAQVAELAERGADVDATIRTVTTDDVREACDVLRPQWEASDGVDGRVSIEVDPRLAHDADKTIAQAIELWKIVDRPNLLIKIPATEAGLPAITAVLAEGISVNVTLIFSVERYRAGDGRLPGRAGRPAKAGGTTCPRSIRSPRSSCPGWTPRSTSGWRRSAPTRRSALRGKAGVANARLAYAAYEEVFVGGKRFGALAEADGARVQRPLWASTGVKNPDYSDTLYVTELVAPNTVNTMPEKTIDAVADHGVVTGDTITGTGAAAQEVFDELDAVGIDLPDVFLVLENEGVEKFEKSWQELLERDPGAARRRREMTPASVPGGPRRWRQIRCGTSGTSGCPGSPGRAGW